MIGRPSGAEAPDELGGIRRGRREYPDRPIVGVGAVIVSNGGVVLVKRRYEPLAGRWSLPGGAVEVGETLTAGLAREILEETGLVVDVGPVVDVFDRITRDEVNRVRYHFVLVDYLCWPSGGELQAGSDVEEAVLVDPRGLEPFEVTAKVQSVVTRAIELNGRISRSGRTRG